MAAPSPSESGDITTAPLRLLKTSFMEQYYAWFLWMTRWIGYMFGTQAHSLYTRNSLDPQDTEAWKYYYNERIKDLNKLQQRSPAQNHYWCKYLEILCWSLIIIIFPSFSILWIQRVPYILWVMSPDSEGLGAAVIFLPIYIYIYIWGRVGDTHKKYHFCCCYDAPLYSATSLQYHTPEIL